MAFRPTRTGKLNLERDGRTFPAIRPILPRAEHLQHSGGDIPATAYPQADESARCDALAHRVFSGGCGSQREVGAFSDPWDVGNICGKGLRKRGHSTFLEGDRVVLRGLNTTWEAQGRWHAMFGPGRDDRETTNADGGAKGMTGRGMRRRGLGHASAAADCLVPHCLAQHSPPRARPLRSQMPTACPWDG